MTNPDDNVKLTTKEWRDITIQAGIEAIPYFGSSLATLYFGAKQERQFKRLKSFYSETAKDLEALQDKIAPIEAHDKESLVAIIEELNEKIEHEQSQEKLELFKSYLKNSLINPVKEDNFDERKFFLNTLGSMTLLECELLINLYKQSEFIKIDSVEKPGVDKHAIAGSIGTLKNYGFLEPKSTPGWADFPSGIVGSTVETIKISSFGKKFCEFCLQTSI